MPQYELNLREYWQIISKRRLIILIIFLAVLLFVFLHTRTLIPEYRATATIMISETRTLASVLTELTGLHISDPMTAYVKVITSLPIIEEAVKQLGLIDKDATAEDIRRLAGSLRGAVSAAVQERTNIIMINVTHQDPQLTSKLANKIAEVFIASNLRERTKEARKLREFIETQVQEVEKRLTDSEDTLKRFKEKESPSGIALALQDRLIALETEKNKISKIYTNIHPDIIKIDQQIQEFKSQLKELPESELTYARLTREVEINDGIFRDLKKKLQDARIAESEKVENVTLVDPAFPSTSPIGPNKGQNYFLGAVIGLVLGLTGAFLVEQLDTSIGTIEEVETFLKVPVLGVIPYLKTEKQEMTFIKRLRSKKLEGKDRVLRLRNQLLTHYPSTSTAFESYRMLRTNIQNEVFKEKIQGKILLLTSAGPEEGKSITICNLAIAMAQSGLRTLLMDADMRRSVIHKIFGLKNKEPGLCDLLRGTDRPDEAIRKFTDIMLGELGFDEALKVPGLDNLSILTSGSLPAIPAELLGSTAMNALLEQFRQKFDLILIDTPPALAVADTTIIASKSDGVILVYRVGKTARSVILRTKTHLIESGAQVKGVVLNNISPAMEMRYGYYYHYKYYGKYYTLKSKEK